MRNLTWLYATLVMLALDVIVGGGNGLQLMLAGRSPSHPAVVAMALICLAVGLAGLGLRTRVRPIAPTQETWVPTRRILHQDDGTKVVIVCRPDGEFRTLRWTDLTLSELRQ